MVLLDVVDSAWKDHLLAMDYLRSAVSQRFNEVDYDFKRLCSALDKTSRPLGETIAGWKVAGLPWRQG